MLIYDNAVNKYDYNEKCRSRLRVVFEAYNKASFPMDRARQALTFGGEPRLGLDDMGRS